MILITLLVLLQLATLTPGLAQTPSLSNDPVDLNDKILQTSDLDEDLLKWEAPIFFKTNVPYYHAGYDHDGRPVWVAEFGKYPVKQFADFKEEDYQVYDKYIRQGSLRLKQSIKAQNTTDREVNDIFLILDFDGLNVYDFASPKSILVVVRLFRAYKDILNTIVGVCFGINMNYISELAVNIVRPVIGRGFEKVELYGTNSAKWKAALRRRIPSDAIPTWYGGSPDFKPIRVYG